jgi:hypothetical protein
MSIKQNGGVFGRNPTFNDVTIEGQLTFDGDIDINSDLKVDGELEVTGEILANGGIGLGDNDLVTFGVGDDLTLRHNGSNSYITNTTGILVVQGTNSGTWVLNGSGQPVFKTDANAVILGYGSSEKFRTVGAGISVTGNVAVTSGSGIDFSATAGTGTSELLSDYEEGTWTPVPSRFTGGGITATYGTQAGYYTKVGNLVTCSLFIDIASISSQGTSLTYIGGLPYAPARSYYDAGATGNNTGLATVDVVSFVAHSDSRLYLRQSGNTAANSSADWVAGALSGTITYMTS